MRYTGIQPQYFPRLHYFARILNSDAFVVRDDVQFVRKHSYPGDRIDKSYQGHTPIKQPSGRFLLTVNTKHEGRKSIAQTRVSYTHDWAGDHRKTIRNSYSRAPYFSEIYPELDQLLSMQFDTLSRLNTASILWGLLRILGEPPFSDDGVTFTHVHAVLSQRHRFRLKNIRMASETPALSEAEGLDANQKIIALCKDIGADEEYCGGTALEAYIDQEYYRKNGVRLTVQDWMCREYPQLFMEQTGFVPNLSIIDLLMNVSVSEASDILFSTE